jgi:hydrogenase maturation protease
VSGNLQDDPNRVLIVGYGNLLRGDDGLGWHAAERLRALTQEPDVEILTLHQLTPELMEPISRAGRVIFIDACAGPVPGEIQVSAIEPQAAAGAAFSHHATPAALLAGALALYGHAPQATLITVAGADFSVSDRLSPEILGQIDSVVAACFTDINRPLRPTARHSTLQGSDLTHNLTPGMTNG